MPATVVYLGLGSNVGDRRAMLRRAFGLLRQLPRTRFIRASRIFETSPYGVTGQRAYFNAAAAIRTELSPVGLLVQLKSIEAAAGRKTLKRWAPRPLDIDILFYGTRTLRKPFLTIPHAGSLERRFVLAPLAEIAPGFRPPGTGGRTISQVLRRLKAPSQRAKIV